MFPLVAALAATLASSEPAEVHPAPWYLPRSASLGVFANPPAITPSAQLSWELGLLEQPRNNLVGVLSLGTGASLALPLGMNSLYQHPALLGVGYRSTRELLHWGFTVGAGLLWYRSSYPAGSRFRFEDRVVGYSEATLRVGVRLAPDVVLGLLAGFAAPWTFNENFPGNTYSGGVKFGAFADWR